MSATSAPAPDVAVAVAVRSGSRAASAAAARSYPRVVRLLVGEGVQQAVHLPRVLPHPVQRRHQRAPLLLRYQGVEEGKVLPVLHSDRGVRHLA